MGSEPPTPSQGPNSGRYRSLFGLILALAILFIFLIGRPYAASGDQALFVPLNTGDSGASGVLSGAAGADAVRGRLVRLNREVLKPTSREIRLNLFSDLTLLATRERVDTPQTGGFVWIGNIVERPGSSVTLSLYNDVLAGTIYLDGRLHTTIRYLGTGDLYEIREVDPQAPEPGGPDVMLPPRSVGQSRASDAAGETCEEDGSVIDVMVTFTAAAREAAGGSDAIQALVDLMISDLNTANDDSAANFDWRLVRTAELAYGESGDLSLDLQRMQAVDDGQLDEIHALRDAHDADLVTMLVAEGNGSACGMAYQWQDLAMPFDDFAFGIVALDYPGDYTCSELTLAHEMGHNLGNAHDRDHASLPGLTAYSFGFQSPEANFRDIMAYNCETGCPRINQWANPEVWYDGEPTGISYDEDPVNAADLVRSMNEVRQKAANFRASCSEPVPTDTPLPTLVTDDTPTPTSTSTSTPAPTETPTPSPSPTPTNTPVPTATPAAATTPSTTIQHLFLPAVVSG